MGTLISNNRKEKSITRLFIWQLVGKFALQGIGFLTMPIFTRLLTTEDYGRIAVYSSWVSFCGIFIGLQTSGSIANAKIRFGNDKMDGYLSNIMAISFISFIIILFISIVANKFFVIMLGLRSDLIILMVLQSFGSYCIAFITAKMIFYKQIEKSTLLSFSVSILSTGLALFFLYGAENRYIVKIYAGAMPTIFIGIIIFLYIILKGRELVDKAYWKYCLSLTLPLILHNIGGMLLMQTDKVMLQRISGDSVTGIYSIAYTVSSVILVIYVSFNTSWVPFYYEYKKNNQKELMLIKVKNYFRVFSIIVLGFMLLVPEVIKIITPKDYWLGIQLIPLIVLAFYFEFLYSFPVNFEFYNEKTHFIGIGTICAALINVICNFFLIRKFSQIGAAIGTVISYLFLFLFHEIIARYFIKGYDYKISMYIKGLIPVSFVFMLFYFTQDYWFIRWAIGLFLGIYLFANIIKNKGIF